MILAVRTLPNRRFDWDAREWIAPADTWVGARLIEILEQHPELSSSAAVDAWLATIRRSWVGYIRTTAALGTGWFALQPMAGTLPAGLRALATEHAGAVLLPFTAEVRFTLDDGRVYEGWIRSPYTPYGQGTARPVQGGGPAIDSRIHAMDHRSAEGDPGFRVKTAPAESR